MNVSKIIFLDIETVPLRSAYSELGEKEKELWGKKAKWLVKGDETPEDIYPRAGIYAEFGKVVCISCGMVKKQGEGEPEIKLKSFAGYDEKEILEDFATLLEELNKKRTIYLCAHNGKEFDFPYIARRMLVNNIKLPALLSVSEKKPWEVPFLDTMEMWKFGDYKHYTSLELLAHVFKIPTPKDDIDGSQVADVYYKQRNLSRIVRYCEKDVQTIIKLYLRMSGEKIRQ